MTRLTRLLASALDGVLAELGITYAQYRVLVVLAGMGEASGAQISRRLHVTAPTVNGLLVNLEAAGYITRKTVSGRAVPIVLTESGRRLLATAEKQVDAVDQRLESKLSRSDSRVLEDFVDRLADDLQLLLAPRSISVRLQVAADRPPKSRKTRMSPPDPSDRSMRAADG